jgi:hypothetical protein
MKTTRTVKTIVAAIMICGVVSSASALTETEADTILFMKQEEKLARDVYLTLHARWGATIFYNIASSEQNHMNAVNRLIVRYRLNDTTPAESGRFSYVELDALYKKLIAKGNLSLKDALEVGELIEKTDIADLRKALKGTNTRPIKNVFGNLLNGSLNHLAAFRSWLK